MQARAGGDSVRCSYVMMYLTTSVTQNYRDADDKFMFWHPVHDQYSTSAVLVDTRPCTHLHIVRARVCSCVTTFEVLLFCALVCTSQLSLLARDASLVGQRRVLFVVAG